MGLTCTLLMFVIMVAYTAYKIDIKLVKKSVDILQAVQENHFDDREVFGADQGLNIAVGVVNPLSPRKTSRIDPKYGRIRFLKLQWLLDNDAEEYSMKVQLLQSHPCSADELGLNGHGESSQFYPIQK